MSGEGRTPALAHISALDGARGLAVAGVLLFHGGHVIGGYLGVDFFFTLSGFLITSLLLAESNRTGSIRLSGFWARRARRLLPALAVLLIGVAVYAAVIAKPDELAQIRGDAFATLAYVANWRAVFANQDYWAIFRAPSPLNHTWSLAIEEQFYVIWPLVFVGLLAWRKRNAAKAVLVTTLVLAAVSSILMIALYDPNNTNRAYYGTDTRAAAILLGAALAAALAIHGPARSRNARVALEVVGLVGAVTLALAWTHLDGQSSHLYRGGFLLCGIAATAVIAAAVHPRSGPVSRVLSLTPLCALGLVSYGVYLYHWPINIVFDQERVGLSGWPLFFVQTAITLAVAIVSYRIIEQPIRRGALSSARWRVLTPAIGIGLVALLLTTTTGAQSAAPPTMKALPVPAAILARRNAPPDAVRILIAGDSVAGVLAVSMRTVHAKHPIAVFDIAKGGCIFPAGITRVAYTFQRVTKERAATTCDDAAEPAVLASFRPQIVFWITSSPATRMMYKGQWIKPCEQPYNSIYKRGLRREIKVLGATGAKVVVVTAAYFATGVVDPNTDCDNALRRQIAKQTGAQLVDLFKYICPKSKCRRTQDGVELRRDGLHYFGRAGEIVSQWLLDQVD